MRVLLAWEFGSNWGHLATLLPLALALRARGHDVVFVVRGLDGDLSLLTAADFTYLSMPIAIAPLQQMHKTPVLGYADVLARGGFADARTLTQLTRAWSGILHYVNPEVVVCKYAPLAEFATRDRPVLSIGTGFELPPLTVPLPSYGPLSVQDRARLSGVEKIIHQAIHAQAAGTAYDTYDSVAHAFGHTGRILLTCPEFDHFGARADGEYLGGVEDLSAYTKIHPALNSFIEDFFEPATFAYLRVGMSWLETFLDTTKSHKISRPFIIVDPTLTQADCDLLSGKQQIVMNQPIDIKNLMARVDTFICHAGHGTITSALAHSKRLLMLPRYLEQTMLAHRVIASQPATTGVALMKEPLQPVQVAEVHASLLKMDLPKTLPISCEAPIQILVDRIEAMVR